MTDTPPDTLPFLKALDVALAAANTPESRQKRERLAELSREAEVLSRELTAMDAAITDAEVALNRHLNQKHGAAARIAAPAAEAPPPRTLEGTSCDDLLDGSVTEDNYGRYEAKAGVWVRIRGEAA